MDTRPVALLALRSLVTTQDTHLHMGHRQAHLQLGMYATHQHLQSNLPNSNVVDSYTLLAIYDLG